MIERVFLFFVGFLFSLIVLWLAGLGIGSWPHGFLSAILTSIITGLCVQELFFR